MDRGTDTTGPLTEVRTVLNRAQTAIRYIEHDRAGTSCVHDACGFGRGRGYDHRGAWNVGAMGVHIPDPDREEMLDALRMTVALLMKWQRTGRKRR